MPDEDPGDVFLRHRGLVLDVLLVDLGYPLDESAGQQPGETEEIGDDSVSVAVGSRQSARVAEDLPPLFADSQPMGTAEPPEEPSSPSPPRRAPSGPSASDRINALLSGQPMEPDPDQYGSEMPTLVDRKPEDESEEAASAATAGTEAEARTPEEMARQAAQQLRNPRVLLLIAAVIALVVVLILIFTGGSKPPDQSVVVQNPPPSAAPTTTPEPSGQNQPIQPESAQANCPKGGTPGMNAFSGEPGKAWTCPRAYKVDGQVLHISLGKKYKIASIGIMPGFDHVNSDGTDQWKKYRTVSRVQYQLNNAEKTTFRQQTLDQRTLVVTNVDPAITASEITLTVVQSGGSSDANSVAISSIVITGRPAS